MLGPPPLIPPLRFQIVEENVCRGAFPSLKNYRFLRRLNLKTIISLTPEDVSSADVREFNSHEDLRSFCKHENVRLIHFNVAKHAGMIMMTPTLAAQNWNLSSIFREFMRHLKNSETITREESQFIESFRAEIEIPHIVPKWLWQGRAVVIHPTMQIKTLPPPPSLNTAKHSDDESNRRRQALLQAIRQGSTRVETLLIRGLLLPNGFNETTQKKTSHSSVIEGLGLEGLYPFARKSSVIR